MAIRARLGTAIGLAMTAVALLVAPALAWETRVAGMPRPVADPLAYFIGHNAGGWHLVTSGPGPHHHFSGVLTTDGQFTDVQLRRPELLDAVQVTNGGHELRFSFQTWDGADGVDFQVAGGTHVTFTLDVDGHRIAPGHIYLGRNGAHPEHNPLMVRR